MWREFLNLNTIYKHEYSNYNREKKQIQATQDVRP